MLHKLVYHLDITLDGNFIEKWNTTLTYPVGITIGNNSNMYVTAVNSIYISGLDDFTFLLPFARSHALQYSYLGFTAAAVRFAASKR